MAVLYRNLPYNEGCNNEVDLYYVHQRCTLADKVLSEVLSIQAYYGMLSISLHVHAIHFNFSCL